MHNTWSQPSSTRKRHYKTDAALTQTVRASLENDDLPPPPWPQLQR